MENFNTSFLEELYILEPTLREKEKEILELIDRMRTQRPTIHIDEQFKNELKNTILVEFAQKKTPTKIHWFTWWNTYLPVSFAAIFGVFVFGYFFGKHMIYPISSPTAQGNQNGLQELHTDENRSRSLVTKESLPEKAFGSLSFLANNGSSTRSSVARPEGGGGYDTDAQASLMSDMKMMPFPTEMTLINYAYSGELALPLGNLPVYEKSVAPIDETHMRELLVSAGIDGFDIKNLKSPKLTMLAFSENRPFGYSFNIDFQGGTISLYQNYETWPQPKCDANGCEALGTLTNDDLEKPETIIENSYAFLREYDIDASGYGTPVVDIHQYTPLDNSVPEVVNITFPILIDGKMTYEENGGPRGLAMTYDVRNKRISSFYGLGKEVLKSSEYPLTTNTGKIREILTQGGRWGGYTPSNSENKKTVTLSVNTPEVGYMRLSHMDKEGKYKEYFIPALIFPVEKSEEENISPPTNITIPLIDEFLSIETPKPMPIDTFAR